MSSCSRTPTITKPLSPAPASGFFLPGWDVFTLDPRQFAFSISKRF